MHELSSDTYQNKFNSDIKKSHNLQEMVKNIIYRHYNKHEEQKIISQIF